MPSWWEGHRKLSANLHQSDAGDPVAFGDNLRRLVPDLLVEFLAIVIFCALARGFPPDLKIVGIIGGVRPTDKMEKELGGMSARSWRSMCAAVRVIAVVAPSGSFISNFLGR